MLFLKSSLCIAVVMSLKSLALRGLILAALVPRPKSEMAWNGGLEMGHVAGVI